jgi:5-methylcytosine-specific restriction endonuclease McrA
MASPNSRNATKHGPSLCGRNCRLSGSVADHTQLASSCSACAAALKSLIRLYERSEGFCELRISPKCWRWITFESMHTCHVIHRSQGGTWDLDNLKAGCPECHTGWEHNGGKPCTRQREEYYAQVLQICPQRKVSSLPLRRRPLVPR